MEKSRLKHLGARRGDLGRRTLKLGSVVIRIDHIAAIMMAEDSFCPNDNATLRRIISFVPPVTFLGSTGVVVGGVLWGLGYAEIFEPSTSNMYAKLAIAGGGLAALAQGIKYALNAYASRAEGFFRLMVETSGGTRFAIVDHEVKRLTQVREVLYRKIETGDPKLHMTFDLDTEKLDVYN